MKKFVTVGLFLVAIATMSFVISKDEPRYKNLKILPKDITKDQMDSVMHHFAGALGQKCNFCHVFNQEQKTMDFASDEKQAKETAREMMKMMIKLNKKFFEVKDSKELGSKLQVTCFTCHHGEEHPGTQPMMHKGPPPPPPSTDSSKHQ